MVDAALDSEVEPLRCDHSTIRCRARWASAGGSTRSARAAGGAAYRHIRRVRVDVQGESIASTTVLQSVVRASEAAIARGRNLGSCIDGVAAVAFR